MIRIATCRPCRIEITYESEDSSKYTCPLCDKPLKSRKAYRFGPLSMPDPVDLSDAKIVRGGGSISAGKIAIKENAYTVLADCCDICGQVASSYSLFRIGPTHYAACEVCYGRLNLVRVKRTRFRY